MKQRTLIVLAVVATALLGFIVLYERHTLTSGELEQRRGRLLESFVRARLSEVRIDRADEPTLVLQRQRDEDGELGEWKIVEPVEAAADFDAVDSLLGALEWADARRRLTDIGPQDRERFGLEEPVLRASFVAGDTTVSLAFGGEDPQEAGLYLSLDDPTQAYVVGKDLFEAVDHGVAHFRSKDLLVHLGVGRATRLRFSGDDDVRLEQRDGRWWIDAPALGYGSGPSIGRMLGALAELRAERFIEDEPTDLSVFGLDSPRHDLTIERDREEEEAARARLLVGAACADHPEELYVRVDDGPVVCVLASALEALAIRPEELREARLVTTDDDDVQSIEIETDRGHLVLTRQEDGGFGFGPNGSGDPGADGEVEDEAVAELLNHLRAARAADFLPAENAVLTAHGLIAPSATLTLTRTDESAPEVVRIGYVDAEVAYARRDDEPVVLRLSADIAPWLRPSPILYRGRIVIQEAAGEATRLTVRRGPAREEMVKDTEGWHVRAPIEAPADDGTVRRMLRRLADLRAGRWVSEERRPEHGLGGPRFIVEARFETAEAEETHDHDHGHDDHGTEETEPRPAVREYALHIGGPADDGAFARLDDGPVFVLDQALVDSLEGTFVSRGVLGTDASHVRQIVIEAEGQRVQLSRVDGQWQTIDGQPAHAERTRSLLDRLAALRATSAHYGPPDGSAGLSPPQATVGVTRTDDAPLPHQYTLLLGTREGTAEDGRVVVRRQDLDVTYRLPATDVHEILSYRP